MRNPESWKPSKFEQIAGGWRASRDGAEVSPSSRLMADRIARAYSDVIARYASGDLLDLGCGRVPLYGAYRDRVSSATCVDWPGSLHTSQHLDVEADLSEPLPLPTAGFDTVLLTDVLEHLPYPERVWDEMARVLRPGGHVIVGVPFMYWLHEVPNDHHRYTEFRLRLFCSDRDFDVLDCWNYGSPFDVPVDITAKVLQRSSVTRWAVPPLTWLAERAGRSRTGRSSPIPLGYILVARQGDQLGSDR